MKKFFGILLLFALILTLSACNSDQKKADEQATPFIRAMLNRDEAQMALYLHPDYIESAIPSDDFYTRLTENHFFTVGAKLDSITTVAKTPVADYSGSGSLVKYSYIIDTNQLFYNVDLIILDDERGYGVAGVYVTLNAELSLGSVIKGE